MIANGKSEISANIFFRKKDATNQLSKRTCSPYLKARW